MIADARSVPLGNDRCIIEREKALDLLEDIKARLPAELAEAHKLVATRNDYISSAKREAEAIRKSAEEHSRVMVSEQEIVRIAKGRANELVNAADGKSRELRRVANEYVDDTLRRTEEAITAALDEIRKSRSRFRAAAAQTPVARRPRETRETEEIDILGKREGKRESQ